MHDADQARQAMLMVPAIGPDLLARAQRETGTSDRLLHMTIGATTGVPYKLYAVEAGARGVNSLVLVIATVIARQPRFLLTAAAAVLGAYSLARLGLVRFRYVFWAGAWLIVYAIYFGMRMTA